MNFNLKNLKSNWYFPLSATAFFILNARAMISYFAGLIISFFVIGYFSGKNESFLKTVNKADIKLKIFSAMTAAGICWNCSENLYRRLFSSLKTQYLNELLGIDLKNIFIYAAPALAVMAFISVYIFAVYFFQCIIKILRELEIFDDIDKKESAIYIFLFIIIAALVTIIFLITNAFYNTQPGYIDVIYTSDSPMIHSYMSITGRQGIHHALYVFFTAPFLGAPYFIAKILGGSITLQALMMNYIQIIMLFISTFLIAKVMDLTGYKRVIFFMINFCSYTYLLAVLMMEHYIVYFFWLSLLLYSICRKKECSKEIILASGGTIITSFLFAPLVSEHSPLKNFRAWLHDMLDLIYKFLFLIIALGRSYLLLDTFRMAISLTFGEKISFIARFHQYTGFIHDCFFAPLAGSDFLRSFISKLTLEKELWFKPSWQLLPVKNINYIGIIIFILAMLGAAVNWKKKSSRLAFVWVLYSFLVLCVVGWGTSENGLILYSLYFAWAFFMLIYQLIEKIEEKLHVKFLIPLYFAANLYMLVMINIPAIKKMVDFAVKYYPVVN